MSGAVPSPVDRLTGALRHLELTLITVLFLAMVILGLTQIGLRNIAGVTVLWIDPLLRALVLWTAMLASIMAAGELRHIRIDLLERLLPGHVRAIVQRLILAATACIAFYLGWLGLRVVALERSFGDIAFFDIPVWVIQFIVPAGFFLMGFRFLLLALYGPPPAAPPGAPS